jgi:hypothetical protein
MTMKPPPTPPPYQRPACLTRRDFLKGTAAATLAASIVPPGLAKLARAAPAQSAVTIVRHPTVLDQNRRVDTEILQQMLDQAVIQVTGRADATAAWRQLFKPDDVVGLVPTPHLNPTHDEVVTLVKTTLIRSVGVAEDRIVMAQGGIRRPKRCSALIALPGLKAHWLTGAGTVLKNYIMYSGAPSRYHGADSAKLGEIWQLKGVRGKTRLILVDALYPLCDKGPQPDPRYQWPYRGVIAGTDPVAVEAVGLEIITAKRAQLRGEPWPLSPPPVCLEAADTVYGLGNSDLSKIEIKAVGWEEDLLV